MFREFERKREEMQSLEMTAQKNKVSDKRAQLEALRCRADLRKRVYEKIVRVTHAMTLNHLHTGLPDVFQAMRDFVNICMKEFKSVYNFNRSSD